MQGIAAPSRSRGKPRLWRVSADRDRHRFRLYPRRQHRAWPLPGRRPHLRSIPRGRQRFAPMTMRATASTPHHASICNGPTSATTWACSPNTDLLQRGRLPRSPVFGRPHHAQYEPASTALNRFGINCNNPLLSADEVAHLPATVCARPTPPGHDRPPQHRGPPAARHFRPSFYPCWLGLKGELSKVWSYDLYGNYGITSSSERSATICR